MLPREFHGRIASAMRRNLVALVALLLMVQAALGHAATNHDIVRTYAGIQCTFQGGSDPQTFCFRSDRKGYAGAVARSYVSVFAVRTGRLLFHRDQPVRSPGYGPFNDTRVFHRESHGGITCAWTRSGGGAAICNRADRRGYVVVVARTRVSVANERSQAVYVKNQPA